MIVVNHGINSVKKLKETPKECGVEIDIRPYGKKLILNHEPFCDGEDFEEFIKQYNHKLLILNIKSEGIEEKVIETVERYGISKYFLLDVTFPFMIKYINKGIKKMAARFSEFESIETCMNLSGKVEWIFVDNFTKLPTEDGSFNILKKHFKVCVVAPDLFGRNNEEIKGIIKKYDIDAVLTDDIDGWEK